jgi:hypothetical protein
MIRRTILPLWLLVVVALGSAVAAHPVAASRPPARQGVYPPAGAPGTMFFFSASSFRSERVGYWFNAPDGTIYSKPIPLCGLRFR